MGLSCHAGCMIRVNRRDGGPPRRQSHRSRLSNKTHHHNTYVEFNPKTKTNDPPSAAQTNTLKLIPDLSLINAHQYAAAEQSTKHSPDLKIQKSSESNPTSAQARRISYVQTNVPAPPAPYAASGETTITFPQNPRSLSSDTRASENRSLGRTDPFAQPVRFPLQHSIPPTAAPAEESLQRPRHRTVAMAARIRRRRCVFECVVEPVLGLDAGGQRLGIHLVGGARDAKQRCSMCCIRAGAHRARGAESRVGDKFP